MLNINNYVFCFVVDLLKNYCIEKEKYHEIYGCGRKKNLHD